MKSSKFETKASKVLSGISHPFRIKILLTIGNGEACVCHLEAVMNKRQAFISQHLMALRKAGILDTRRDGKYVYYRLADSSAIDIVRYAGKLAGLEDEQLPKIMGTSMSSNCGCPNCAGGGFDQSTINVPNSANLS